MMMKKFVCGLLVSTMLLSLGVGCSKQPAPSTTDKGGSESAETAETVQLKAHFIGASPIDGEMVEEAINKYASEKLGITLDMTFTDFGDYDQKTQMIINSGESYDIIFTCAWANDYLTNSRKGAFLDLTSYLEMPEYAELKNTIDPGFWEGSQVDGKIYAVPTQKEIAIMPMFMFNEELAEQYTFDTSAVKTLKDAEPFLEQIKANNPEVTPLMIFGDRAYRGPHDYILGFDYPLAVITEGEDMGKVVNMYDLPDVKDYVYTMRDFFQKGYVNQDAATKTGSMQKGEVFGMSFGDGQPYAEVTWSNDSGFKITAEEMTVPIVTTSTTRGSMMAINKNSKNPEAALKFVQAINTDSTLHNMLNYGIEGVHYEKVGENQIRRTEVGDSNYLVPTFALGNLFNTYILEGEPEDKWEVFKAENSEAFRSPLLGLDIDTTSIKNELAAISNLRAQYAPLIQTGSVDPDKTIAEFNKKLSEVGFQKVLDEVQKQVDAFLENK